MKYFFFFSLLTLHFFCKGQKTIIINSVKYVVEGEATVKHHHAGKEDGIEDYLKITADSIIATELIISEGRGDALEYRMTRYSVSKKDVKPKSKKSRIVQTNSFISGSPYWLLALDSPDKKVKARIYVEKEQPRDVYEHNLGIGFESEEAAKKAMEEVKKKK